MNEYLDAINVFSISPFIFCRTYQHIEMLGLFLFNDSLVITRRTTRNFPFDRAVEHTYRFEACASLNRLRVEDIADSKCELFAKSVSCCE